MLKVVAIAVVGLVALSSCKKDYTCECKTGDETAIVTTSTIENKTLKDAQSECEKGSGTFAGITRTCNIR
jgi:hypothetical protein